jgi:hypothetical protein
VRLPEDEALAAGRLRLRPDVTVCAAEDGVWIRGPVLDPELSRLLRGMPGAERFHVDPHGRLTRSGRRLPTGKLPAGPWLAIASYLQPRAQAAHRAPAGSRRAGLALVRAAGEVDAGAVLVSLADWSAWALGAPEIRLKPLRFAVAGDDALVVGQPVPPVRGERLLDRDGVLVPCGWDWSPPADPSEVRALAGAATGGLVLLGRGGHLDVIEGSAFVRASRSAVRLTVRGVGGG